MNFEEKSIIERLKTRLTYKMVYAHGKIIARKNVYDADPSLDVPLVEVDVLRGGTYDKFKDDLLVGECVGLRLMAHYDVIHPVWRITVEPKPQDPSVYFGFKFCLEGKTHVLFEHCSYVRPVSIIDSAIARVHIAKGGVYIKKVDR